jgi:glycosyltransferase involved in cell wall biosynthesis
MLAALAASAEAGCEIKPLDIWSRSADFDILHLWGYEITHINVAEWAKRAKKRVLLTALLPYKGLEATLGRIIHCATGFSRLEWRLRKLIDRLVVVNEEQAQFACSRLGFSRQDVSIVPNIVHDNFWLGQSGEADRADPDYVLCTGNICSRKGQLRLAKVCLEVQRKLLIVGDVLTGEEAYGNQLRALASGNEQIQWMRPMVYGSKELVNVYRNARCFATLSSAETQPISALEAAVSQTALVLPDRPFAWQHVYENAKLVDPFSSRSSCEGIEAAWLEPNRYRVPLSNLKGCSSTEVGLAYQRIYTSLQ